MNNVKVIMLPPKITVSKYYAKKRTADMWLWRSLCRNISALLNVNQVEHKLWKVQKMSHHFSQIRVKQSVIWKPDVSFFVKDATFLPTMHLVRRNGTFSCRSWPNSRTFFFPFDLLRLQVISLPPSLYAHTEKNCVWFLAFFRQCNSWSTLESRWYQLT